jgi:putative phage-type endonuclease
MNSKTRSRGIGGSEIAAVVGLSRFARPIDIWVRKTGQAPEQEVTHHMQRGTYLGPALAQWYAGKTGYYVSHYGRREKTLIHPVHSVVRATPDGQVREGPRKKPFAAFEGKSPDRWNIEGWGEEGTDQIPYDYMPQVIWEMAVLDVDRAEVGALIDGDLQIYSVPWDQELFDVLVDEAKRFWRDYVETNTPPPADGSPSHTEYLQRRFPEASADMLESNDPELDRMVLEYAQLDAQIKGATKDKERIKQELIERIGEHEGLRCAYGKAYYRNQSRCTTDYKRLCEDLDISKDTLAKYQSTKSFRAFRPYFKEA